MKLLSIFLVLLASIISAQNTTPVGNIDGTVADKETLNPLPGVNIIIANTNVGISSDEKGHYVIEDLNAGTYTLEFSYIGYEKVVKTDVIVRPQRTTTLNVEMLSSSVEIDNVVVEGGYFSELDSKPVSTINFSAEEIRRAPGSAGDVSRIVYGLPSLAKVNDSRNSLIVRGGSPLENSFFLDNIEIPNINHFQIQGSSDGPIGLLNTDFIDDVNFIAGGFSPLYGNKLSSVMEITYREGTTKEFNAQAQMSMAGFGLGAEGPLGNKGSYMFSASRSYLDLIVDQVQTGGALPKYGDFQGKVTYNIDDKNKISLLNIFSKDDIGSKYEDAYKAEQSVYGVSDDFSNIAGINWRRIWGDNGYSNTSVSYMINSFDRNYYETKSRDHIYHNLTKENVIRLRNVNYIKLSKTHSFEFGIESSSFFNSFDFVLFGRKDSYGNIPVPLNVNKNMQSFNASLFALHLWKITDKLKLEYGIRTDYSEYNDATSISPRLNLSYKFGSKTTLSLSSGIFYQNLPDIILTQNNAFNNLKTPRADHYVLGLSRMIGETTRLSIEAYYKKYTNMPVDPAQPYSFLFDQVMIDGLFLSHNCLQDNGSAFSRGIEIMVQKKLADEFYGLVSASFSKSRYKDFFNKWHDRIYDNEFNFSLEGGYIPNNEWEFKVRWIYAGGAPYTPFDITASQANNTGVWDLNRVNGNRLPDYHSLNIRIDKRFYFNSSNLIVYLSVWNAYGRDNIAAYSWNEIKNIPEKEEQWSTLPVIGFEFEF